MTDLPNLIGDVEEGGGLIAQTRMNEIDRRASALTFRLGFLQWLVLPVFYVALVAMVVGLFLGLGALEEMVGGIIGIGGGAAGLIHWAGQLSDEIYALEDERASASGCLPASSGEAGGQLGRLK